MFLFSMNSTICYRKSFAKTFWIMHRNSQLILFKQNHKKKYLKKQVISILFVLSVNFCVECFYISVLHKWLVIPDYIMEFSWNTFNGLYIWSTIKTVYIHRPYDDQDDEEINIQYRTHTNFVTPDEHFCLSYVSISLFIFTG